jgi:hypothetical protein
MTKTKPYARSTSPTERKPPAIPVSDLVSVPPAREMDEDTFKLHLGKRHPHVHNVFFFHHEVDHRLHGAELDHVHKEQS